MIDLPTLKINQIDSNQPAESGDNLEEQAAVLKSSLEKDEHSQIWGRYQTYNKNNPEEKGRVDTLSKKEKRT